MGRGEDIPQDVWDAALSVATSVRPNMNGLAVVLGSECFDALLTNIARAIMAAKAAERERCAKVCSDWLAAYGERVSELQHTTPQRWANDAVADIRDLIKGEA